MVLNVLFLIRFIVRFDDGTIFFQRFNWFLRRIVPLDDSLMFRVLGSEPFYLFDMAFEVEIFVVVTISRDCAWDVVGEERTHMQQKQLQFQGQQFRITLSYLFDFGGDVNGLSLFKDDLMTLYQITILMREDIPPSNYQYSSTAKVSSISRRFNPEEMPKEDVANFDETAIIDHYHHLQYQQYRQLSEYNISDTLKQKLFGFPEGFLFFNHYRPEDIIISNHPMRGRTIMDKNKHSNYTKEKLRQINIKGKKIDKNLSSDQEDSEQRMKDISSGFSVGKSESVVIQDKNHTPASYESEVRLMPEQTV